MFRPSQLLFVVAILGLCGCGGQSTGPVKHPVRGTVKINGQPAVQVALTFHHSDETVSGNLRYATGVTRSDGSYELSTEGDRDGAIEGEYRVTLAWLSSPGLEAYDMLGGAYSRPEKSTIKVQIPSAGETLPPIELQVAESAIRRPGTPSRRP